jgi:hypothetical protein
MIIPNFSCDSLENYLTKPEIEVPSQCPICSSNLWKHDSFVRSVECLRVCAQIDVPRVLCHVCNQVFSCLFAFLIPYKRLAAAVNDRYVYRYVSEELTLRESAWVDDDALAPETSLSRSSRGVSEACESSDLMLLHEREIAQEPALESEAVDNRFTSLPVRAPRKAHQLQVLREIMLRLRRRCGDSFEDIQGAYRELALVFRFPTPQSLKHALF